MSATQIYIPRILNIIFRLAQLLSSAIVTGIVGHYIRTSSMVKPAIVPEARFIYTCVASSTSIVYAFASLILWNFTVFPADLLFFVLNLAAFGSMVNYVMAKGCPGWDINLQANTWLNNRPGNAVQCPRWAAAETFTFVSAILFLISACMAVWKIWKLGKQGEKPKQWYRCL